MKYIQELREGERLSQIFFCKNKTIATTKAGKTYYSLTLQDKTGVLDGKVWELSGAIEHFENLDFIKIDGDVTLFNGSLQLNCRRIRKAKEGEYDQKDYFPVSEKDPAVMFKELDGFIQKVKEPHLNALLLSFLVIRSLQRISVSIQQQSLFIMALSVVFLSILCLLLRFVISSARFTQ